MVDSSPTGLSENNLLDMAPRRSASWTEAEGSVVIERPRPTGHWLKNPLRWLGFLLSTRRIRLDDRGSFVWRRLDGRQTVRQLAGRLREEFGDQVEPAEERIGILIRFLRSQDLVVYPGQDGEGGEGASPSPTHIP